MKLYIKDENGKIVEKEVEVEVSKKRKGFVKNKILEILNERGGWTQKELSEKINVSSVNVNMNLRKLIKEGKIGRVWEEGSYKYYKIVKKE